MAVFKYQNPPLVDPEAVKALEQAQLSRDAGQADTVDADLQGNARRIGSILAEVRELTADQVQRIANHQRDTGQRFGDAAVALGLASTDDVLQALSQQFQYTYAPESARNASPELVMLHKPFGAQAESIRAIRSQLLMRQLGDGRGHAALAVVSPDPGDGKTYFAANLAVGMAQLGGRTLVIDADLRGPRLHEVFGVDNTVGLSGILAGRGSDQVIQQVPRVPSLFVLPVGTTPPNPLELIERPAFGLLMRELATKFDHVVVDTPAAVYGADATVIAARCGAALIIARKNTSRIAWLQDLLGSFAGSPAKVAGVVVNER